jgi:LPXTG-site transpeptidase (sortase) family protein
MSSDGETSDTRLPGRRRWTRQGSNALVLGGLCLVALAVFGYARAAMRQDELKASWGERPTLPAAIPSESDSRSAAAGPRPAEGDPVARIRIPRVGLDAVVLEGISDATLSVAPGHYPGTAFPGEGGHVVLAAHRDSFFKDLGDVEKGDPITLTSADGGQVSYRVTRSYIVHMTDRTVIVPKPTELLTLITCYPFKYVGHAPYRYIIEAVPDATGPPSP